MATAAATATTPHVPHQSGTATTATTSRTAATSISRSRSDARRRLLRRFYGGLTNEVLAPLKRVGDIDPVESDGLRAPAPVAGEVDGAASGDREEPGPNVPLPALETIESSDDRHPDLRRDVLASIRRDHSQQAQQGRLGRSPQPCE